MRKSQRLEPFTACSFYHKNCIFLTKKRRSESDKISKKVSYNKKLYWHFKKRVLCFLLTKSDRTNAWNRIRSSEKEHIAWEFRLCGSDVRRWCSLAAPQSFLQRTAGRCEAVKGSDDHPLWAVCWIPAWDIRHHRFSNVTKNLITDGSLQWWEWAVVWYGK